MQIDSVEKHEVFPTNPPSNGVYSFRGGFPTVQFQIASQDKLVKEHRQYTFSSDLFA